MSSLKIVKKKYLNELEDNLNREGGQAPYESADEFLLNEEGLKSTHLELADPPALMSDGDKPAATDSENAVLVHQYLKDLSLNEATVKPLWVYLTHGPFFKYCQWRWSVSSAKNPKALILSRWFHESAGPRGLFRNAVARLWWVSELTHAPWEKDPELERFKSDDPYFYTKVSLYRQDIYQNIFENVISNSLRSRICALDVIEEYRGKCGDMKKFSKELARRMNCIAKHTDIAGLEADRLHAEYALIAENLLAEDPV